jgi:hypothetical protein
MNKYHAVLGSIVFICLLGGILGGFHLVTKRGIPFVRQKEQWSIGIYRGKTPFSYDHPLNRLNPILKAEHVKDINARFVADPFLIKEEGVWYLFFEVFNDETQQGDLAVATSNNSYIWHYQRVILDEPFHLSYPYVFKWEGNFYMIPESSETNSVRLYKATNFPYGWEYIADLIEGRDFIDNSVAYYNEKWWLFTSQTGNNILRLYYADELSGPWFEHQQSPIVENDAHIARPGGRVLIFEDRIYRFTQDSEPSYGNKMWAFEITEISTTKYSEILVQEEPILKASGSGWNGKAMHQLDPVQVKPELWVAAVDGFGKYLTFGLNY